MAVGSTRGRSRIEPRSHHLRRRARRSAGPGRRSGEGPAGRQAPGPLGGVEPTRARLGRRRPRGGRGAGQGGAQRGDDRAERLRRHRGLRPRPRGQPPARRRRDRAPGGDEHPRRNHRPGQGEAAPGRARARQPLDRRADVLRAAAGPVLLLDRSAPRQGRARADPRPGHLPYGDGHALHLPRHQQHVEAVHARRAAPGRHGDDHAPRRPDGRLHRPLGDRDHRPLHLLDRDPRPARRTGTAG